MRICLGVWGLALTMLVAALLVPRPAYHEERVVITNALGLPLHIVLFLPKEPPEQPLPAALICQPLNNPPAFSKPMGLEFVRSRFVVATFDWAGAGGPANRQLARKDLHETLRADVAAALAYLQQRPEVAPDRVVVVGHSVGANLAVDGGIDVPGAAGVACIGMAREIEGALPRNLLWAAGLYDEFWPPGKLTETFEKSTGTEPDSLMLSEVEHEEARRSLAISPSADHLSEMFDRRMHRAVVNWLGSCVGVNPRGGGFWMEGRCLLYAAAWLAALAAGTATALCFLAGRRMRYRLLAAACLLVMALADFVIDKPLPGLYDLLLYLLLVSLVPCMLAGVAREQVRRAGMLALHFMLVLWATVELSLLMIALPHLFRDPVFLAAVPEFVLKHPLDYLYAYALLHSRQFLFSGAAVGKLDVRVWVYGLLAVHAVKPDLVPWIVRSLTAARSRQARKEPAQRISRPQAFLLITLVLLLAGLVWFRLGQGFITKQSLEAAGWFILKFSLLPIGIFLALWRLTRGMRQRGIRAGRA